MPETREATVRPASNALRMENEAKPESSVATMLMGRFGGLLTFFGLTFGLVAAIANLGFLVVCLVTCAIAILLFLLVDAARRKQIGGWERVEKMAVISAKFDYCGYQNAKGVKKC